MDAKRTEQAAREVAIRRRIERRPEPGKEYTLRVVPNSGGRLELVEKKPEQHWLYEWTRVMNIAPWGL